MTRDGAASDELDREVRLVEALLAQVVAEQSGEATVELVARSRAERVAIRAAAADGPEAVSAAEREADRSLEALAAAPEPFVHASSLHFQLLSIAEQRHRVRNIRRAGATSPSAPIDGSVAAAIAQLRAAGHSDEELLRLVAGLVISPVLTAHPTEARRRTVLVALRRVARLIDQLEDPRLGPDDAAEARRRILEELTNLWQTAEIRTVAPSPLDEVRAVMVFFDETLFTTVPRFYRALDAALDAASGTHPPLVPAVVRLGSWVGGDRDGNPNVTAETTAEAVRVAADHVLRGYAAVASRLMQSVSAVVARGETPPAISNRLASDEEAFPETMRQLRSRFGEEPYRQRLGAMAERLRRTRAWATGTSAPTAGRYRNVDEVIEEVDEIQRSLAERGLERVAYGEVADFRWQLETFGFHLASLEVRQHSAVHRAALAALQPFAARAVPGALSPRDLLALGSTELVPGVTPAEVLATFRSIAQIQSRFGEAACRRYVISFTLGPQDVLDVLRLADYGLVADLFKAVPELQAELNRTK